MSAKILIVDDDIDFRDSTTAALEAQGFDVRSVANGKEARAALKTEKPDLVILDVMMSWALEGLRLSLELKRDAAFRDIPQVMVTSIQDSEYAPAFPADQPLRVDELLRKPVEMARLVSVVRKALSVREEV